MLPTLINMLMAERMEREGLPGWTMSVVPHESGPWLSLRPPFPWHDHKSRYLKCPGLPKDERFLADTLNDMADWLMAEARKEVT